MVNLRKIAASMGKKTHLIPVNVVNSHYIILLKRDKERRDKEHIRKEIDIFFHQTLFFSSISTGPIRKLSPKRLNRKTQNMRK